MPQAPGRFPACPGLWPLLRGKPPSCLSGGRSHGASCLSGRSVQGPGATQQAPGLPPVPSACLRVESRGSSAGSLSGWSRTPALPTVPPLLSLFSEIVTFQLQAGDQRQSLPGSGCGCVGTHGGHHWPCLGWGSAGRAFRGQARGPSCPSRRGRHAGGAFSATLGGDPTRRFALTRGVCPGGRPGPPGPGAGPVLSHPLPTKRAHISLSRRAPDGSQPLAGGRPAGLPQGAWRDRSVPPSSDRCFLYALPEAWRRPVIKWHVQRGLWFRVAAGWVLLGPCLYVCPWPAGEPCRQPGQQLT